jgi:hypothetical protein
MDRVTIDEIDPQDQRAKEVDMRRVMFKASCELADGVSDCTFPTVGALCEAIQEWAENYQHPRDAGESFSVELVAMTDAEYDQLPEI